MITCKNTRRGRKKRCVCRNARGRIVQSRKGSCRKGRVG